MRTNAREKEKEHSHSLTLSGYRSLPSFWVNQQAVSVEHCRQARPHQTLLEFLRDVLLLKGTKLGCNEGGCGACTVLVTDAQGHSQTVNACLVPVLAVDGCRITTVEGIGTIDQLHPVQEAMVKLHGSQCGFCTPGIIVSLYGLAVTGRDLDEHLDGNLCRCTGYRPIWDVAHALKGPCGEACATCPQKEGCELHEELLVVSQSSDKHICSKSEDWVPPQAPPSPPTEPLAVVHPTAGTWLQPPTLEALLQLMKEHPCKIVVGHTEVGIETKFQHRHYPRLIHPRNVTSLYAIETVDQTLHVGACASLSQLQDYCHDQSNRTCATIHDMLRWFASTQIRNVACLGGNLVTASPISDMVPVLLAAQATIVVASMGATGIERRHIPASEFILSYRKVDLQPHELVEKIEIPLVQSLEFLYPFKQARRREDDISIVTSAMRVQLAVQDGAYVIADATLAYGGMAPTTVLASNQNLVGKPFCRETIEKAMEGLIQDFNLPETVPGGQAAYRRTLAASFLLKCYASIVADLRATVNGEGPPIPDDVDDSAAYNFVSAPKPQFVGTQTFPQPQTVSRGLEGPPKDPEAAKEVGKPTVHQSGALHCTGQAVYADDIPLPPGTLQAALVLSKEAGGVFQGIDTSPAMEVPGVVGVLRTKWVLSCWMRRYFCH